MYQQSIESNILNLHIGRTGYIGFYGINGKGGVQSHELCFIFSIGRGWLRSSDNGTNQSFYIYTGGWNIIFSTYSFEDSSANTISIGGYGYITYESSNYSGGVLLSIFTRIMFNNINNISDVGSIMKILDQTIIIFFTINI